MAAAKSLLEERGSDYERYALRKLFHRLVKKLKIKSVLEIPAKGEKAMPSLYSLAFAEAGCSVTLVNAEQMSKPVWAELGYMPNYIECKNLDSSCIKDRYDLVWNFMHLCHDSAPKNMLEEMKRLSKKHILFVSVNRFNVGFPFHRLAHKISGIEWNHGSIDFMNPFFVSGFFKQNGLRLIERGVVDTPPWPDSMGIRDIRLHRLNIDLNKARWESKTISWMKNGKFPKNIEFYYLFERLPLPWIMKLPYAHLFYVVGETV